jgi:hypothetical protein
MVAPPPKHPNEYEHSETIVKFFLTYLFYGLLGGFIGRLIDKTVVHLQGRRTGRLNCILFSGLQISLNSLIFYAMFKLIFVRNGTFTLTSSDNTMTFDDWMSGTFQGLIFATTIYSAQDQLPLNLKGII